MWSLSTGPKSLFVREKYGTHRTRFYITHCFHPGHPMLHPGHVHSGRMGPPGSGSMFSSWPPSRIQHGVTRVKKMGNIEPDPGVQYGFPYSKESYLIRYHTCMDPPYVRFLRDKPARYSRTWRLVIYKQLLSPHFATVFRCVITVHNHQ